MKNQQKPKPNFIHGLADFSRLLLATEHKLRALSVTPCRRHKLTANAVRNLSLRARPNLPAGNLQARIVFAEECLSAYLEAGPSRDAPRYFLTLVPAGFTTASTDQTTPPLAELRLWARKALEGVNFIAAIDIGAYRSIGVRLGVTENLFSWHVHAIVWGPPEPYYRGLVQGINATTVPLRPGFKPAHCQPVSCDVSNKRLLYAIRFPTHEYQAWIMSGAEPPRWQQKPKPIRPGTAAQLATQLADATLSDIVFGGGDGETIVSTALSRARAEMIDAERQRMKYLYGHVLYR